MAEAQGPEAQLQHGASQISAVDDHLRAVLGLVGQAGQGQGELGHPHVQVRPGLDGYPGRAPVQPGRYVEVGHHGLGHDAIGQDVHVAVFGA